MNSDTKQKVIVVTGASSGLGKLTAQELDRRERNERRLHDQSVAIDLDDEPTLRSGLTRATALQVTGVPGRRSGGSAAAHVHVAERPVGEAGGRELVGARRRVGSVAVSAPCGSDLRVQQRDAGRPVRDRGHARGEVVGGARVGVAARDDVGERGAIALDRHRTLGRRERDVHVGDAVEPEPRRGEGRAARVVVAGSDDDLDARFTEPT